MKLTPWSFTPTHQPGSGGVKFELKPLTLGTFYELQRSLDEDGKPSFTGMEQAVKASVIGWQGVTLLGKPLEYSQPNLRRALDGIADMDWAVWIIELAGELYAGAIFTDDERKNS